MTRFTGTNVIGLVRRRGRSALGAGGAAADDASVVEATVLEACDVLAAVADPIRFGIVRRLAHGRRCVCDLQADAAIAANLLSYHLRVLREAGLVEAHRRGRWVDYELAPGALERLARALPAQP